MLHCLLHEMIHFGSHEELNNKLDSLLMANDIISFYIIINDAYDKLLGNSLCSQIHSFLVPFICPIEENVIKYALGLSHYDWSRFVNSYSFYLTFTNKGVALRDCIKIKKTTNDEESYNMFLNYHEIEPIIDFSNINIILFCLKSSNPDKWLSKYLFIPEIYYKEFMTTIVHGWIKLRELKGESFFNLNHFNIFINADWEYEKKSWILNMLTDIFPEYHNLIIEFGLNIMPTKNESDILTWFYDARKWMPFDAYKSMMVTIKSDILGYIDSPSGNLFKLIEIEASDEFNDSNNESIFQLINRLDTLLFDIVSSSNKIDITLIEEILTTKAQILMGIGKNKEALEEAKKALFFSIQSYKIHLLLSQIYERLGNNQAAIYETDFALSAYVETFYWGSSKQIDLYNHIADMYRRLEEYDAERYYRHWALKLTDRIYTIDSENVMKLYKDLGDCFYRLGQDVNAVECYRKYNQWVMSNYSHISEYDDEYLLKLIDCLFKQSKFSESINLYMEISETFLKKYKYRVYFIIRIALAYNHLTIYNIADKMFENVLDLSLPIKDKCYIRYFQARNLCNNNEMEKALYISQQLLEDIDINKVELEEGTIHEIKNIISTANNCIKGVQKWSETSYANNYVPDEWKTPIKSCDLFKSIPEKYTLDKYNSRYNNKEDILNKVFNAHTNSNPSPIESLEIELQTSFIDLASSSDISKRQHELLSEWITNK